MTVRDDSQPEKDEDFEFELRVTGVGESPADVSDANGKAVVTVIANDDAGGVFGWVCGNWEFQFTYYIWMMKLDTRFI